MAETVNIGYGGVGVYKRGGEGCKIGAVWPGGKLWASGSVFGFSTSGQRGGVGFKTD